MKYKVTYRNGGIEYTGLGWSIREALAVCCREMRDARRMNATSIPDGTRTDGWQLYREVKTPHWEEITFNG